MGWLKGFIVRTYCKRGGDGFKLASRKDNLIREGENMMQHPSNYRSITISNTHKLYTVKTQINLQICIPSMCLSSSEVPQIIFLLNHNKED